MKKCMTSPGRAGRKPGSDGKLPAVGNTVDVASASWANTIGAADLGTIWTDPDFDPAESAFYYARVLEIPTPAWYVYDAFRFGIEIPEDAPKSQQERAYTSPIWYSRRRIRIIIGRWAPLKSRRFEKGFCSPYTRGGPFIL